MALRKFTGVAPIRPGTASGELDSILYAEDDDASWQLTERHLRHRFNLVRAKNAREVFDLLTVKTFRLILMDIELSGSDLDGIKIVRILRGKSLARLPSYARNFHVEKLPAIIFVTAYSARYSRDDLMASGGDEAVAKPVDFVTLTSAITRLILRPVLDT